MIDRQCKPIKTNSFFLFGARGTGKSTLVKSIFQEEEFEYLNLLIDSEYYQLSQDPDSLIKRVDALPKSVKWIVLDEVQRIPELLNIVHHLIEERKELKFALTGSSSRKLKRGGSNLLAGRAFLYELFPLTFEEAGDNFDLDTALTWGSLPSLLSFSTFDEKSIYLETYVETYLKEEIIAEQLVRKLVPFRRFLDIGAQMNTKILNFSSISRDVGVSVDTVQQYFSILEDTHIGYLLPAYHASIRKRQVANPKFYLFDRGVTRALERLPGVPVTRQTSIYGEAFEHFLILEFIRANSYKRKRYNFSYLRTKDGAEIDLIIERPGAPLVLVEIKSKTLVGDSDVASLSRFRRDFSGSEAYCLSQDPVKKKINGVEIMSWREGFRAIFG